MRLAARTDTNQAEIVSGLRKLGIGVVCLHMVGKNVPDLLVGFRGHNYLFEVKSERGKLSKGQQKFMDTWPGQAAVIRDVMDALRELGAIDL
jgi:Holliday junction resolvase